MAASQIYQPPTPFLGEAEKRALMALLAGSTAFVHGMRVVKGWDGEPDLLVVVHAADTNMGAIVTGTFTYNGQGLLGGQALGEELSPTALGSDCANSDTVCYHFGFARLDITGRYQGTDIEVDFTTSASRYAEQLHALGVLVLLQVWPRFQNVDSRDHIANRVRPELAHAYRNLLVRWMLGRGRLVQLTKTGIIIEFTDFSGRTMRADIASRASRAPMTDVPRIVLETLTFRLSSAAQPIIAPIDLRSEFNTKLSKQLGSGILAMVALDNSKQ